jgi:hypothetical protein
MNTVTFSIEPSGWVIAHHAGLGTTMAMGQVSISEIMAGMKAWNAGTLIQNAFPNLSPQKREFLITGLTPEMWDALIPDE